jgi:flagellar biosynthesis/type III secretory pathway protein FliH
MQQVSHAVEILRLQAERLAEQARSDAIEIGFQVARRVLEAELSTSPQALFALVRSALKRAGESRRVCVRLHPEDAKLIGAAAAGALGISAASIEVAPDPSLERGDCIVDTDFGKVDGRLRTRLDELHRAATAAAEGAA